MLALPWNVNINLCNCKKTLESSATSTTGCTVVTFSLKEGIQRAPFQDFWTELDRHGLKLS